MLPLQWLQLPCGWSFALDDLVSRSPRAGVRALAEYLASAAMKEARLNVILPLRILDERQTANQAKLTNAGWSR